MSEPFIGEVKLFACGFAPMGWVPCDGRTLPIVQYQALYAVIGPAYGGDGRTTFAVPDLRGRAALHAGQGTGLTNRAFAAMGGAAAVTLNTSQLAAHTHSPMGSDSPSESPSPVGQVFGVDGAGATYCFRAPSPGTDRTMAASVLKEEGGGGAHNNMQPYLALNFCMAFQGLFPVRE